MYIQAMPPSSSDPKDTPLGKPLDLSYLGKPFHTSTQATPQGEEEAFSRAPSDSEVDNYDVDKAKRRIIVMALERVEMALRSKHVSIAQKAEMGLKAMAQFEGTRRVVEWDKRVADDKELLSKADHLGKKLQELAKKLPKAKVLELEMKAVEAIAGTSDLLAGGKDKN